MAVKIFKMAGKVNELKKFAGTTVKFGNIVKLQEYTWEYGWNLNNVRNYR